jgi:hypothetical protein
VDDENEEAEDEEYELNYGEEIDGEGKFIPKLWSKCCFLRDLFIFR